MSSTLVELCSVGDIADGKALGLDPFDEGNDRIFVVRNGENLTAYRNICPHQGSTLPWRKNEYLNRNGTKIVCAAHGAEFDIESGECTLGAALGMALLPVPLEVSTDGKVMAQQADLRKFY